MTETVLTVYLKKKTFSLLKFTLNLEVLSS